MDNWEVVSEVVRGEVLGASRVDIGVGSREHVMEDGVRVSAVFREVVGWWSVAMLVDGSPRRARRGWYGSPWYY